MPTALNQEHAQQVLATLTEYFDGFVCVGFSLEGNQWSMVKCNSDLHHHALRSLLEQVLENFDTLGFEDE